MRLAEILGYQLGMARCAALRNLHRHLADSPYRPADTAALLLVREQPGCDQTTLGRMLAGDRSVGMKVASRLERRGLLTREHGRDRRSKGLFITHAGEGVLDDLLRHHRQAERRLSAGLTRGERAQLLRLLGKVRGAIEAEESAPRGPSTFMEIGTDPPRGAAVRPVQPGI